MASLFKLIAQSCGLHSQEAAEYLGAKSDTVKSWWHGRRTPPESVIEQLLDLSIKQDIAAQELLIKMGIIQGGNPNRITLKLYDDRQARQVGWPSANAYRAIIRKVVEKMPPELAMHLVLVNDNDESDA